MIAGMALALEDHDAMALCHRPGRRGAGYARADYRDVVMLHVTLSSGMSE
jgi:hypothetical protein